MIFFFFFGGLETYKMYLTFIAFFVLQLTCTGNCINAGQG